METIDISRALVPVPSQEDVVRQRFWDKVRRTLGRVPFLDEVVAAYYAATDPATPRHAKAILFAALAYFVIPLDVIPDLLGAHGFTDDLAVILTVIQTMGAHIRDYHRARARAFFDRGV